MAEQGQRMKRKWERLGVVDENGEPIEEHVREIARQALLDLEATGHNLGGAFVIAPIRVRMHREDGSEHFPVAGWAFEWTQYVPAIEQDEFRVMAGLPRVPEMLSEEPEPVVPTAGEDGVLDSEVDVAVGMSQ